MRSLSTLDHPREFLFPVEQRRSTNIAISNKNSYSIYLNNKSAKSPAKPKNFSFNFTNASKLENKTLQSSFRLYPEKAELLSSSTKRSLTPTSNAQKIKVKGLDEKFNELALKRTLRHEGIGVVYCRQNYNKINNKGDGTGEILLEDMKNINHVQRRLKTFGLQIEDESINHGVKYIISEKFARMLQTEKCKVTQHNYFRA